VTVTTLKQALAAPRAALPGSAASNDVRAGALAELGATGLPTPRSIYTRRAATFRAGPKGDETELFMLEKPSSVGRPPGS